MVQNKGEYAQLRVQVISPTSPTSPTPRFRTSTPQAPDSPPPSPERVPRALRRRSTRWSFAPCPSSFLHPRLLLALLILLLLFVALVLRWAHATWELHLMLDFYPRQWWAPPLKPIPPLRGCFDAPEHHHHHHPNPLYNVSERVFGARRTDVQAGTMLSLGMDCYDFAGTVAPPRSPVAAAAAAAEAHGRTDFHSFWPAVRAPFGARQEAVLRSFLATQPRARARLVLWSDRREVLVDDALVRAYKARYGDAIELRGGGDDGVDLSSLAEGTELEGSGVLVEFGGGGDLVFRLLVLWRYGGVWVDMDSLLTRDLTPLLEHEFVTQWECDADKRNYYRPATGALMRFYQHSPYLCEAFHVLATSPSPPRYSASADWHAAQLFGSLWPRLVAEGWPPFKILPFCFSDGRSCHPNQLPDPLKADDGSSWSLEEGGGLDRRLQKVFAVHLHDRGNRGFPDRGWVQRLLIQRHDRMLSAL